MKHTSTLYTSIKNGMDIFTFLFFLLFIEAAGIYLDLRTSVVYDWVPILTPLIWIDISFIFIYIFLRNLYLQKTPPKGGNSFINRYLKPNYKNLLRLFQSREVKIIFILSTATYFIIYSYIQGMLAIDPTGNIEPRFNIVSAIIGYGPVLVIAPTRYFILVITPYLLSAAISLSLFSGLAITLLTITFMSGKNVKKILPTPLLGLSVVCPTCILSPATAILISTFSLTSTLIVGGIPIQTFIFTLSTALLITTLLLLWISISILSKIPVSEELKLKEKGGLGG